MPWRWRDVLLCSMAMLACGSDPESGGAGEGGSGGGGGSGGEGGACACPSAAPATGDPCDGCMGVACTYFDCDGAGQTSTSCGPDEMWTAATAPCEPVACGAGARSCNPGQICLQISGGALQVECTDNPCESLLDCECAAALCPAMAACSVAGGTVYCNTCPENDCP